MSRSCPAGGTLADLVIGQAATIVRVDGQAALVQRLLEMGLLEGEAVELVGVAPLGDPLRIRLRDYQLSLRRSEAACVYVDDIRPALADATK